MVHEGSGKCQRPGCVNEVWLDADPTKKHEACGRKHHHKLIQYRLWASRDINMKMECQLSGCQRHVYVEPGPKGRVHDYCGKTHAKQGGDLVDDKCCLNGGHPSPGHASDQVVDIKEPLQCLKRARQVGVRSMDPSVSFIDSTNIYASHPWDIPEIKRSLESATYKPPSSWYTLHTNCLKGKRKQRSTVDGYHWKQAGPSVSLEERDKNNTLKGKKTGLSYELPNARAGAGAPGVGGHWRMDEWNITEIEAETSTTQESTLVLCQIKHVLKKRKKRESTMVETNPQPFLSPPVSPIGPNLSPPLDFLEKYLNQESIDDITGVSGVEGIMDYIL